LPRSDFPDADSARKLQQSGSVTGIRERTGDFCEIVPDSNLQRREKQQSTTPTERGRRRQLEPGMGGVASGISPWLDGYWAVEPDIPRIAKGVKDRVKRLHALGNSVVPTQAYPLFHAIMKIENEI
jgi:hypothetical protein